MRAFLISPSFPLSLSLANSGLLAHRVSVTTSCPVRGGVWHVTRLSPATCQICWAHSKLTARCSMVCTISALPWSLAVCRSLCLSAFGGLILSLLFLCCCLSVSGRSHCVCLLEVSLCLPFRGLIVSLLLLCLCLCFWCALGGLIVSLLLLGCC